MGSIMSGMKETMEENFKKQQEFQLNTQRLVVRTRCYHHALAHIYTLLDGETNTGADVDA